MPPPWLVTLTFPDDETATLMFCCVIGPLSPGLLTRIEMKMFCASFWLAGALESAAWFVEAS